MKDVLYFSRIYNSEIKKTLSASCLYSKFPFLSKREFSDYQKLPLFTFNVYKETCKFFSLGDDKSSSQLTKCLFIEFPIQKTVQVMGRYKVTRKV